MITCAGLSIFLNACKMSSPSLFPLFLFAITIRGFQLFIFGCLTESTTKCLLPLMPTCFNRTQFGGMTQFLKGPRSQHLPNICSHRSCTVFPHQMQRKSHKLGELPHPSPQASQMLPTARFPFTKWCFGLSCMFDSSLHGSDLLASFIYLSFTHMPHESQKAPSMIWASHTLQYVDSENMSAMTQRWPLLISRAGML